jgi:hypothetical protein
MTELATEIGEAVAAMRLADYEALADAGVDPVLVLVPQLVGAARVTIAGARYRPDRAGELAYDTPIRVGAGWPLTPETPRPEIVVRYGQVADLVAWHPRHPSRWALRRGDAEWLGAIEPQCLDPFPSRIWRGPLGWLQNGCRGLALLTRDRAVARRTLAGLASIVAEDDRHAAEVRRILAHPFPSPPVTVWRAPVRDAA